MDIQNRADIEWLITRFYEKVMKDEVIGYLFTDVAKIGLPSHLPRLFDFWSTLLLGDGSYKGNPMGVHIELHKKSALHSKHFDRWLALFNDTLEERFDGPKTEEARTRAQHTAQLMLYKVQQSEDPRFIQ